MTELPEAIPAATAVIFREVDGGPPQLLMVERAAKMVFAAGAMVFPGGRIDPGDYGLAATLGGGEDIAARIAAVRETVEEAGLPIGMTGGLDAATVAGMREALHTGVPFSEVLADYGAALNLGQLVPFARWRPAHRHMRIFDTRFYLTRLPDDAPPPTVDATENVRLLWATAAQVLAAADSGDMAIIFPTRRNLERLARFNSFAEALADAARHPVTTVTPWSDVRDGEEHLCIPEGIGYPITSERITSAMRG